MSVPCFRPARAEDLEGIVNLARAAGQGVTTLQPEHEFLADRIFRSTVALDHPPSRPGAEEYQFVVEDDGEIVACSAVLARVGGYDPFYTYEIRRERLTHPPLGVDRTIDVMHLKRDHKGPSELCGLAVAPPRRGGGIGRLASFGRLLFVAAFPERFAERIIAEIRGVQNDDGRAPFWDAVGSVFFAPSAFEELDVMTGLGKKDFIADLMPKHPIYLDLLPEDVRAVVGQPHRDSRGAASLLGEQGFAFANEVDIFDAGPILECPTAQVGIVAGARRWTVDRIGSTGATRSSLIARVDGEFRAVLVRASVERDEVTIDGDTAEVLGVAEGDTVLGVQRGE